MSKSRNDSNRQRSMNQDGLRHRPTHHHKRPINDRMFTRQVERAVDGDVDFDLLEMEQQ